MERLLRLLREKNFYLERFLQESEKERRSFKSRRFDNLESLYKTRKNILITIEDLDKKISEIDLDDLEADKNLQKELSYLLKAKKTLVGKIIDQDLVMISCVEREKSTIIKKIVNLREGRKILSKYKSKNI